MAASAVGLDYGKPVTHMLSLQIATVSDAHRDCGPIFFRAVHVCHAPGVMKCASGWQSMLVAAQGYFAHLTMSLQRHFWK